MPPAHAAPRAPRASIRALLLVAVACGASPPRPPTVVARPVPRERLAPCTVPGVSEPLLCGTYPVWENRTTRQGRKIDLHVVVVPGLGKDLAPDPIVSFAGGPGDAASHAAAGWVTAKQLRAHRDILLVDQRGTGGSHPLHCKIPRDPGDVQAYFEPPLPAAEVERCRAELEPTADLTQYTTSIAADDLDEVRAWLGYDQLNLEGGSYGTRAAQVYLRRHGDHVRSVLLVGVAGMDQYLPLFHARDGKHAVDLLIERCGREPACAAAFPGLAADLARVLAALDHARGHATVDSPVDHHPVEVTISRDVFAEQIRFTLYSAMSASATPYVIHRAAEGDFAPFARLAMLWEPGLRSILAYGMHLSVTCAEDVPFITPPAIEAAIAGTYLRDYRVAMQLAACKAWRRGAIPADYHTPVRSPVPALLISGPYDPVTPPRWGEQVAAQLPHAVHLIVPEGHHGTGGLAHDECFLGLITQFFERGSAAGLDTSCVATMTRPPFVTDATGWAAMVKAASAD